VERLCDRLVVIDRGRVISDGTVAQVMQQASVRDVSIEEPHIDDVVRQVYGLTAAQPLAAEGTDRG
jgi:ABC-type uncharacterized transport system ATPase subunit